jgi:PAS domain S-box-containing protein
MQDQLLQAVIDAQPDWVWVVDRDNRLVFVNEALLLAFGRSRAEVLGRRPEDFVHVAPSPDPQDATEDDWLLRTGGQVSGTERLGRLPDGRYVWWQRWKRVLRDPVTGEVTGLVGVTRNITEQRGLERAVLEAGDRERWRLGSELHDGAGGSLAGIDMMLGALGKRLEREGRDTEELQQIATLLRATMAELRGIARGLAPVNLERAGLFEGLRRLLEQVQATRAVRCQLEGDPEPQALLGPSDATHMYRIVQEAINNALQHGRAKVLQVRLTQSATYVELSVDDDGSGMVAQPGAPDGGLGLQLMRYRARLMGGTLTIGDNPAGGTRVVCRVPTLAGVVPVPMAMGRLPG